MNLSQNEKLLQYLLDRLTNSRHFQALNSNFDYLTTTNEILNDCAFRDYSSVKYPAIILRKQNWWENDVVVHIPIRKLAEKNSFAVRIDRSRKIRVVKNALHFEIDIIPSFKKVWMRTLAHIDKP